MSKVISADLDGPYLFVRGQANRIRIPMYQDGSLIEADSATVTVYDASNDKVVDDQAATAANTIYHYDLTDSDVPSDTSLDSGWRVEWTLSFTALQTESGAAEDVVVVNDAAVVHTKVNAVVTNNDLLDLHSELNDLLPADQNSWQSQIDAAFKYIRRKLLKLDKRPQLIISSWSLVDAHIALSLSYVFRDLATYTQGSGKYQELADHYMEVFKDEWASLTFKYDDNEDQIEDDELENISQVVSLHAGPTNRRWWDTAWNR